MDAILPMYGMCIDAHWQNDGRALSTVQNPPRACALCKINQSCALIKIQHIAPPRKTPPEEVVLTLEL